MFRIFGKGRSRLFLFCALVWACRFCSAGEPLDQSKYITIDEVRPGMEAYCLTTYKDAKIEKFGLEVLDVVRNMRPGRNAILVQGTDERFIHTGPVAGCSGSPVYIDGRLAGALAFGWTFSKDPLYGVTPIEEMLVVGEGGRSQGSPGEVGFVFDYSAPIDFVEIDRQITAALYRRKGSSTIATALPCPLVTSGLPAQVCEQLGGLVEPLGLMVVPGIGGGMSVDRGQDAAFVPGACLAVPLVTGDITLDVMGTVTDVVGDKVYGFGHGFLGMGAVDLPMATGRVHTVVSSVIRSFKFATAVEIIGALAIDESTAVLGHIGAEAKMISLTIRVDRYNDDRQREYKCRVANNRLLTPLVIRTAVAGAALMRGNLPPDHMIEYKVNVSIKGAESISFENISTNTGLTELILEGVGSVAILMNNPYRDVDIESIEVAVREAAESVVSHIWAVDLSDSRVKAGEEIEIGVVVETFQGEKKRYEGRFKVPDTVAPGKYNLIVCGGKGYLEFLRKSAPHRFVGQNLSGLIRAVNNVLAIRRDRLYCVLVLPPSGISVETAELPDLPATKALVMQDAKRTLRARPYQHWIEKSFRTGVVIVDKKVVNITVEK